MDNIDNGLALINIRMERLKRAYNQLSQAGDRYSGIAVLNRVLIIVLAAFVGIRGVVEQQMKVIDQSSLSSFVMAFTLIGFLIAVLSGLEQAFKFEKNGAGLKVLAQKVQSMISHLMLAAEDPGINTYQKFYELAIEQDKEFDELSQNVLQFGLTLKSNIEDFTRVRNPVS